MEEAKWVLSFIAIVIIFIAGVLWGGVTLDRYSCGKLNQTTGIETKYVFLGGGCLVKVNDRFIPQENWRGEYQQ